MQTEFRHCQFNGRLLLMVILEILPLVPVISIKVKVKTQPMRRTHSDWILRAQSEAKCFLCSSYEETQMIRGEIEVCMPWSLSHIKSLSSGKGQQSWCLWKPRALWKASTSNVPTNSLRGHREARAPQWPCTHTAWGQRFHVSSFWCPLGFAMHIAHFLSGTDEVPEACRTSHSLSSWQ